MNDGTIYLLHFDPPYRHAGHYLGWTAGSSAERLEIHLSGRGSPLVRAALAAGSTVRVVREWPGGRTEERRLKNLGGHGRLCPLCRGWDVINRRRRERRASAVREVPPDLPSQRYRGPSLDSFPPGPWPEESPL